MKGSAEVVQALGDAIAREAHLSMQYSLDVRSLRFMGIKQVAEKIEDFAEDGEDFLKKVTKRLLFLGGNPSYQIAKVNEQADLTALLQNELNEEMSIVTPYEGAVRVAMNALDDTTRNLFEHLLKWHEDHVEWLEKQLALISGIGEATYISAKL